MCEHPSLLPYDLCCNLPINQQIRSFSPIHFINLENAQEHKPDWPIIMDCLSAGQSSDGVHVTCRGRCSTFYLAYPLCMQEHKSMSRFPGALLFNTRASWWGLYGFSWFCAMISNDNENLLSFFCVAFTRYNHYV